MLKCVLRDFISFRCDRCARQQMAKTSGIQSLNHATSMVVTSASLHTQSADNWHAVVAGLSLVFGGWCV